MSDLAIRHQVNGTVEGVIKRLTDQIKELGFGILTVIDFDQKIKEKLGETLPKTVVLGACNPKLAFEAYKQSKDVTLLIPCNIVVRECGDNQVAIEAMRPSAMLRFLPQLKEEKSVLEIEKRLETSIRDLK